MLFSRLSLIILLCLVGGCQQEKNPEDFGEVIYEIPVLPDEEPSTEAEKVK